MPNYHSVIRTLLYLLPVILFGGLLWNYLAPSGERVVTYEMGDVSPFVQRPLPDSRVGPVNTKNGDSYVTLLDEPVYFSVMPPAGNFEHITLEVAFDPGGTPTFELGALRDIAAQAFDFRPLSNALLEDLDWVRHEIIDDLAIFSRHANDDTYRTFLETPPGRSLVATYRATFPTLFRKSDYVPLGASQVFAVSLRGPHELLTYIKAEDFVFNIIYTDVNRTYGSDEGFVRVYDENGNLMTEHVLRDDGNIYDNQEPSNKTSINLNGRGWPEGVYRIVLSGTSDIIWRSISTSQRYLVVKNQVFVGDVVGFLSAPTATTLFTNADRITAQTQHTEGLQTLSVGDSSLVIDQVGAKYAQTLAGSQLTRLYSPVGDIKITGEGKYAFNQDSFFDPDPVPVTAFTDLESSEVDYVLANLAPVRSVDGWRVASATFDVDTLAVENNAYKFALSAPGIHDNLGQVSVHAIKVTFSKSDLGIEALMHQFKRFVRMLLP